MKKKILISSLLAATTLAIVGSVVATNAPSSPFRLLANSPEAEWHHYSAQSPSLDKFGKATNKGTKEYWVQCGGSYQFSEPESEHKVNEPGAPNTDEFAVDDDRWSYYCDVNGHDYDEYGVCAHCNAISGGEQVAAKAIGSANAVNEQAPLGFTSVYSVTGLSNGNVGSSFNVQGYSLLYFSIYHNISYVYLFGGNNAENPTLWQNDWYNILLLKDSNGWKCYFKKASETAWTTNRTKVDGATDQNFSSILRMYNWSDLGSATVKCTEVYTAHVHSADEHGICSECKKLIGGSKLADCAFANVLEPENNPAAPAGFSSVSRASAKHNTNGYIANINLSSYRKLYLAVYSPVNLKFFGGDGNNKAFWTNRWNYIYMESDDGNTWTAYGRDPGESSFTQLIIGSQSSNWKWMFSVIRTDWSGDEFNLYSTEIVAL